MRSVSIPSEASSNILWCKASGKSKHDLPQTKEWKNSINKLSQLLCKPHLSATKLKEPCCLTGKQHSTQDDHKTFIIGKHTFQNHLQAIHQNIESLFRLCCLKHINGWVSVALCPELKYFGLCQVQKTKLLDPLQRIYTFNIISGAHICILNTHSPQFLYLL